VCGCLGKPVGNYRFKKKILFWFFGMGTLVGPGGGQVKLFLILYAFLPKIAVTESGLTTDIQHNIILCRV
jgi:hypothetical protein